MSKISLRGQEAVVRSKHNRVESPRLKAFHACVANQLTGKSYQSREEVREAFKHAAHSCKGR